MFEVGRTYKVTTSDHDGQSYRTATVIEVDLPLVKFSLPGNYEVINTSSSSFVSAVPNDDQAKQSEAAAVAEMAAKFSAIRDRIGGMSDSELRELAANPVPGDETR